MTLATSCPGNSQGCRAPSRPPPVAGSCLETATTEQERGELAGDAEAWRRWDSDEAICRHGADLDSCSQPPSQLSCPPAQERCRCFCQSRLLPLRTLALWCHRLVAMETSVMNPPRVKSQASPSWDQRPHYHRQLEKHNVSHRWGLGDSLRGPPAFAAGGAFFLYGSCGAPAPSQSTAHSAEPRV